MLGLPRNMKSRQVLNAAVRRTAGGALLLDRLEKMDYMRIQDPNNPHFAAEVGKLIQQRDQIVDAILSGRLKP
jgi:hypothetical protein